jgi:hypothetical protein
MRNVILKSDALLHEDWNGWRLTGAPVNPSLRWQGAGIFPAVSLATCQSAREMLGEIMRISACSDSDNAVAGLVKALDDILCPMRNMGDIIPKISGQQMSRLIDVASERQMQGKLPAAPPEKYEAGEFRVAGETGPGDYELIPAGPGQLGDYLERLEAALHKENLPMHSLVREKGRIKIQIMTNPSAKTPEVSPFALLNWISDLAEVDQDESLSRRMTSSRDQGGERRWEYRVSPSRFPLPHPDCTVCVRVDIMIPDEDIPEVVRRLEARRLTA